MSDIAPLQQAQFCRSAAISNALSPRYVHKYTPFHPTKIFPEQFTSIIQGIQSQQR